MAIDKKKSKRVATLFGKQKVTTTPEIAAKIKSGEIDPATHSIKDGKFAPKRKAVVGGLGIVPTAKSFDDSAIVTPGGPPLTKNTPSGYTAGSTKTAKGGVGGSMESVAQTAVPKTDKATGQEITPAQNLALQEQKAIKIAPFKEDLAAMSTQLNDLMGELDAADDDDKISAARAKIEKIKASLSATNE